MKKQTISDLIGELDTDMDMDSLTPDLATNCATCPGAAVAARAIRRNPHTLLRRAFSEMKLLDILSAADLKDGVTVHVISGGDIDSLSYLKHVLRQQTLDYVLLSTWCMAQDDIDQLREWLATGRITRLDAYVGEIFPASYAPMHKALKSIVDGCNGRVAVFRDHAKVYAGIGPKYAFAIESSANINTNPRAENTVLTIGADIFQFYKEYFDGIRSFVRDYDQWEPWEKEHA